MASSHWLRSLFARLGQRQSTSPNKPVRPLVRPRLEPLEDRIAPAALVVNVTTDAGTSLGVGSGNTGDLRYCINEASMTSGADTITFDSTVFATPQRITLGGSRLVLFDTTGATTITGPAAGVIIDGNNASTVFDVNANVTVSLSGLTITKGSTGGVLSYRNGGG